MKGGLKNGLAGIDWNGLGMDTAGDYLRGITAGMGPIGTALEGVATALGPAGIVAVAALAGAAAVGGALLSASRAAMAWESSMTGVAKTTGLAGADLNALSKDLLVLSTEMPATATEIAGVAQAAGSLGIAKEEIAGFTEVAIQMGVGFEMSADKAATAGAKILNSYGVAMDASNMEKLGSVVNAMGDSFAATEPQVLEFLNRASFLSATMGQSIPQVAALGTTLISTGLEAEVAATGIKSALNMLTSETSRIGGIDNWANLMGVSVDELKDKVDKDLNATLIETANRIAEIEDPVERFQAAVAAAGTEGAPAILKLAGQQENYAQALGMTNEQWEKANSLQKTYDAQMSTTSAQWQILLNTLNMAGVELGTIMLPAISSALGFMSDLVRVTIKVGEELYKIGSAAWEAIAPLRELWKYTPVGVAAGIEGNVWGAIKDWAGIGTEHAETMAKEIEENNRLQQAGEEAIRIGQERGVFAAEDAGKAAGDAAGEAFAEQMTVAIQLRSADISKGVADHIGQAMQDYGVGMLYTGAGNARWKDKEIYGATAAEELEIAAVKEATLTSTYVVLKTENGTEIARRDIYGGEFAGDPMGAIYDMIKESPELAGLSDIESAELAGDTARADTLKLTTEAEIETELVNLWGDFNSDAALAKFDSENEDAFDHVSSTVQTNLFRAARDIEQRGPEMADLLASSMGLGEGIVDPATLQESWQNVMDALAEPGSVDTATLEASLSHLMGAALISASDSAEIKAAASGAKQGLIDALTGASLGTGETRSLAEIVASGGQGITDLGKWRENVFQPGLNKSYEEALDYANNYNSEDLKVAEAWIDDKQKLLQEHSDWFEDWQINLLDLQESGSINTDEFFDLWSKYAAKADEKASEAVESYKTANAMFYGEILADNDHWSNYINDEGGFVGPTEKWIEREKDTLARNAEIQAGLDEITAMGGNVPVTVGMALELPTQESMDTALKELSIEPVGMTIALQTEQARLDWGTLVQDVEARPLNVSVNVLAHADQIRAIVDAAVVDALA